jgi:hypothetical protein
VTIPPGALLDELAELVATNRAAPSGDLERAIVSLRNRAFADLRDLPEGDFPDVGTVNPASGHVTVDDLVLSDVSAAGLRKKLLHNGAALLPRCIASTRVTELVEGIDRAFEACATRSAVDDAEPNGEIDRWFSPFDPPGARRVKQDRHFNLLGGGIWATDSPRLHFLLVDTIVSTGLNDIIAEYFGERPAISVNKSTLRRVPAAAPSGDWHQDGAFLGDGIRSINAWICLSDCGVEAPGLDLIPRRLELATTGTPGANFDWAVSPDVVEDVRSDVGVLRPAFRAGDVLLFDHYLLHRTAEATTAASDRYAIETWFFAPSHYPDGQYPIAL